MEQDEQADASFDEEPQADELLDAESLAEDVSLYDFLVVAIPVRRRSRSRADQRYTDRTACRRRTDR